MELFQRFEIKVEGDQYHIILHLSPFMEEYSNELWEKGKQQTGNLKESAIRYIKQNIPQLKMATISVVAGGLVLSSFPMKSSAQSANFNMSYLFYGDTNTYLSEIDKTKGGLSQASPYFFGINSDGSLQITNEFDPKLVNEMHKRKMKVVPFLNNDWDRDLGRLALKNREILSEQIADFIMKNNLDGINVNIENVTVQDRQDYTDFVRLLRKKLPLSKEVSVAVAANPNGWTDGWHGSYDYNELSKYADYLFIMAYDEHSNGGPAGPIASYDWVEKSIQFALNQGVPNEKIVLGIPFFGRYWKDGDDYGGYGVGVNQVESIISKYKGVVSYDPKTKSNKAIVTIKKGDQLPVVHGNTLEPGTYVFWYEDELSIKSKIDLVHKYGLKGTGSWSLGDENVSIWGDYNKWLTSNVDNNTTYPLLKIGSKGKTVINLQNALKNHRFYAGTITGIYDSKTQKAVIAFQKKYHLKIDGIAGKEVQSKLYNLPKPTNRA
jgi:spore germination protein YaaH